MRPVAVPYGVESYIDEPEITGWIYYFVVASSNGRDSGRILRVMEVYNKTIMPPSNTIAVNAQFFEEPELPVLAPVVPDEADSGISALQAMVDGEGVRISYRVSDGSRSTILYRSVQPIQRAEDLLRAVIVQSGLTPPFVDYPVPGISYYYAVIFEDELPHGSVRIIPGANATTLPAALSTRSSRVGLPGANKELRSMPLPLMSRNYAVPGIDGFSELSAPIPLSPGAAKALSNIPRNKPKNAVPKKPRAFSQDMNEDSNSLWEEHGLKAIVRGPFLSQDWQTVIAELRRYLSIPRSELTEARARFYLGQSFYLSTCYREALFEFLMVKTQYPKEANEWIDASLSALIRAGGSAPAGGGTGPVGL
jgi:hypothetical protein